MLKGLSEFFERTFGDDSASVTPESRRHAVHVATALLLVEVARADFSEDLVENARSMELLAEFFELSDHDAQLLIEEAKQLADATATLQEFTRKLHEQLTLEEKCGVIEMLWKVALADDRLDKYEDHLVRKIAGLLYISDSDLIRIRNQVSDSNPASNT